MLMRSEAQKLFQLPARRALKLLREFDNYFFFEYFALLYRSPAAFLFVSAGSHCSMLLNIYDYV
jgi:hypothetical protein